ncbi:MAG: GNAT family N-acetyltransferase [Clostridia bacterium]|nr:GNAT family N-acetyltransferase [Clostridia bacterium]
MQRALFLFEKDPFAVRALAGVLAYGTGQAFAGVWLDDAERLLIGRTENAVTVCGECRDKAELRAFLDMIGGSVLLAPAGMLSEMDLPGWALHRTGAVLRRTDMAEMQPSVADGMPRYVAQILADSPSEWIEVGDRDALYVDLSHRLRHGRIHARMIRRDGIPAACAVTMGETAQAAVIGGVACRPAYRGNGLGSAVLQDLCAALQREHKAIYLFTGAALVPYYRREGFTVTGRWQEFRRKAEVTE